MRTEQQVWTPQDGWGLDLAPPSLPDAELVLVFGSGLPPRTGEEAYARLREAYPAAHILGCSTAGEILGTSVRDGALVATAARFEGTAVEVRKVTLTSPDQSRQAGECLARQLDPEGLVHAFVLSDGLRVNGSALAAGLAAALPRRVAATGGLAADGARFEHTEVWADAPPQPGIAAVLGLYGPRLEVGYGSVGGWDQFGPERLITRSAGNVLYELDGRPALDLYKAYLGRHAGDLPASGLLFPLSLRMPDGRAEVVRTILAADEEQQSLTFAGDVPEGTYARLMKASVDRLVDGAVHAAVQACGPSGPARPDLAILVSCVGRKLVLRQRVEEEVEGVRDVLGTRTAITGFYAYGEVSPPAGSTRCELHNQTMTITTLSER